MRVGVLFWQPHDGLGRGIVRQVSELGHEAVQFLPEAPLPAGLDLVLVHGPLGSLVPVANQLREQPPETRPAFILLMTEQLPNPGLPEALRYGCGVLLSRLVRLAYRRNTNGGWRLRRGTGRLVQRANRFRYYGDLYWLRSAGILSRLVLWSSWTAAFLRARGFDPLVPQGGLNEDWGEDLNLERDIPVLWIGKPGSARRKRLLERLRAELRLRGVEIYIVDGVEHPYVFGKERTILINRSKIALNLLREKWDDNSMRYILAARNRALIITEPTLPHSRFIPGKHLVVAPVEMLADTICHYLANDAERKKIVDQAYEYTTRNGRRGQGMAEILEQTFQERPANSREQP